VWAQNAIPDPRGQFGAVTKRDGLGELTSASLGGSIQAVALVPFPGPPVALSSVSALPATGVPTLEIFVGNTNDEALEVDWVMSTDSWATNATLSDPVLSVARPTITGQFGDNSFVGHGVSTAKRFIYPGGTYTPYVQGQTTPTDAPPILSWDGTRTTELVRVPANSVLNTNDPTHYPLPVNCKYIYDILLSGNTIYLIVHDEPTNGGGLLYYSRVLTFDINSYAISEMNTHFDASSTILTAMGVHQNKLFVGVGEGLSNAGVTGKIYRDSLNGSWTLDNTLAAKETPLCMASFNGSLYIGTQAYTGNGVLYKRDPLGVYTNAQSTPGGGGGNGSGWGAMIVFQGNLYAAFYNVNGNFTSSGIMKYTGSAWSTVNTVVASGANPKQHGVSAYIINNVMYFLFIDQSSNVASLQYSPDGTTWTTVTSNFTPSKYVSSIMGGIII
jgi:hypothetical protein